MREWTIDGMIIGRGKPKFSDNLPQCHFVHNKPRIACCRKFDSLESNYIPQLFFVKVMQFKSAFFT
jgi:hypothetical protein